MNELKTLEDRLKSATDRISAALAARAKENAEQVNWADESAELRGQLDALKAQRTVDLEELNTLLEQLRPMMEDTENA